MVLPAVEPLDAVIELFEEARRRLVELFVDLAEEPAVRRLPSSVDELTDEGAVELGWLRGRFLAHLEPNASGLTTDTLLTRCGLTCGGGPRRIQLGDRSGRREHRSVLLTWQAISRAISWNPEPGG